MKSWRKAHIKNFWLKSPSNELCLHPEFLAPFGSTLPIKKITTHFVKVHLVVADTSTRGGIQHGKKKNV
jgi:hypothetical protein